MKLTTKLMNTAGYMENGTGVIHAARQRLEDLEKFLDEIAAGDLTWVRTRAGMLIEERSTVYREQE